MTPITCFTCAWFRRSDLNPNDKLGRCMHENRHGYWCDALAPHRCRDHESAEDRADAE